MNLLKLHTANVGDRYSAPALYFPELGPLQCITRAKIDVNQSLVFGGGGMLYPKIAPMMERIAENHKAPLITWGIGSNTHEATSVEHPGWLDRCTLNGIRDHVPDHRWLPCASCLHPAFSQGQPPKPSLRAVAYLHFQRRQPAALDQDLPVLKNNASTIETVLDFLALGEFVVTNTYHGVYWATLLGRRVIAYPFSSKFYAFKHPPVLMDESTSWQSVAQETRRYADSIEECRSANTAFWQDVRHVI